MKIMLTIDSNGGLEYAPFKTDIKTIRTMIHFKNKNYVDGIDIKSDAFYELLEKSGEVPTTSAPNLGEYISLLEELKAQGATDVIHFPISYHLSNYSGNWPTLINSYDLGIKFHIIDTRSACLIEGVAAKYGEILVRSGADVETIKSECEILAKQMHAYFLVDNLKYLISNGRLSAVAGTIGTLINIKPILRINEIGKIVPYEKIRTFPRALSRMKEHILDDAMKYKKKIVIVFHTNRLDDAKVMADELKALNTFEDVIISTVTPTVGAHIGSKIMGLALLGLDNLKLDLAAEMKKDTI